MASRDNQGLQIAVIVFAMLTIILAITTYIFYAQANSNYQAKVQADSQKAAAENQNRLLTYRNLVMQYVLGEGVTEAQVDAAKTTDDVAQKILDNFKADMALLGDSVPAESRNYRTLPTYLVAALNTKNNNVVTAQQDSINYQKQADATKTTGENRAKAAEDAVVKANDDLKNARDMFQTQLDEFNKDKATLAEQLAEKDKVAKKQRDDDAKLIEQLKQQVTTVQNTADRFRGKVQELQSETVSTFENPDGRITWVNQKQHLVWINVGSGDGLQRQTNFAVFDHDTSGVANATPKGRIEVVRIIDEHLSECRILEDTPKNPILPNDLIHTPSWSPGQRVHFALAGFMDVDGDGQSDRNLIRNIITMNGGVIDAEIKDDGTPDGSVSVNTRYLVLGEKPTDKSAGNALVEYGKIRTAAQTYGVEVISLQKLLAQMGWKAEERTVELGGKGASPGEFRKRTPGGEGSKPAPAAAPAAAPAEPAEAPAAPAAPVADPFG